MESSPSEPGGFGGFAFFIPCGRQATICNFEFSGITGPDGMTRVTRITERMLVHPA